MGLLNILHVSDAHFSKESGADQQRVTDALRDAAHRHTETYPHIYPHICVFSGDLANKGSIHEFELGERWLQELVRPWTNCKVFVVPGNHDVKRPGNNRPGDKLVRDLQNASSSSENYKRYEDEVRNVYQKSNFLKWHQAAKTRLTNLVSDWDKSAFSCSYIHKHSGVEAVLIGLNTALLSCANKEQGKLIADEEAFNECLARVRANEQLIIAVSHHPIGSEKTTKEEWLARWNASRLEELLLQATGPHIYLHGHLHDQAGTALSLSTGQSLAFFGAGAAYQTERYPMRFAFYQIDLMRSHIAPYVYSFNRNRGEWLFDLPRSTPFPAALPRARGVRRIEAPAKVNELTGLLKDMIEHHLAIRKLLIKQVPRVAPELDIILSPGVRRGLLADQYKQYQYVPLLKQIAMLSTEAREALKDIPKLAGAGELAQIIVELRRRPEHLDLLLTALVLSQHENDWDEAERLLPSAGKPFHYLRLGYSAWSEGELNKAIRFSEQALTLALKAGKSVVDENDASIAKIKNNIAYYYAESEVEGKAEEALRFAKDAVTAIEGGIQHSQYANRLDTLGFVQIAFATSRTQIEEGIKTCEDARRAGADLSFYFKHIAQAEANMENYPQPSPDV